MLAGFVIVCGGDEVFGLASAGEAPQLLKRVFVAEHGYISVQAMPVHQPVIAPHDSHVVSWHPLQAVSAQRTVAQHRRHRRTARVSIALSLMSACSCLHQELGTCRRLVLDQAGTMRAKRLRGGG
jgi:hypothetical protein